ncbi:MAG: hypothetical protein JXQ73_26780 [Phycisphaerae bacterium]|nr:hypothetical protein [Phycisphaerae bacterium]
MRRAVMRRCCGIPGVALLVLLPLWVGCVSTHAGDTSTADAETRSHVGEMPFLGPDLGFFPRTWSVERRAAINERLKISNYHTATFMGMTITHVRLEMPVSDLADVLRGHERDNPTFRRMTNAQATEHAFGRHSGKSYGSSAGEPIELSWWQPGNARGQARYSWLSKVRSGPPTRIWIQVDRLGDSNGEVYVRIEHG